MTSCCCLGFPLQAKRFAESLDNAVWTNQFDNTANRKAHFETTGPEIWRQTGKVMPTTCIDVPGVHGEGASNQYRHVVRPHALQSYLLYMEDH